MFGCGAWQLHRPSCWACVRLGSSESEESAGDANTLLSALALSSHACGSLVFSSQRPVFTGCSSGGTAALGGGVPLLLVFGVSHASYHTWCESYVYDTRTRECQQNVTSCVSYAFNHSVLLIFLHVYVHENGRVLVYSSTQAVPRYLVYSSTGGS